MSSPGRAKTFLARSKIFSYMHIYSPKKIFFVTFRFLSPCLPWACGVGRCVPAAPHDKFLRGQLKTQHFRSVISHRRAKKFAPSPNFLWRPVKTLPAAPGCLHGLGAQRGAANDARPTATRNSILSKSPQTRQNRAESAPQQPQFIAAAGKNAPGCSGLPARPRSATGRR